MPANARFYVYFLYAAACAVGAVVAFVKGDTVTGVGLLALLFPTGLAAANTERA